jgi:hypothetical protein
MYPADDDFVEEESPETIEVHEIIEKKKPVRGIFSRGASIFGQT